MNNKILSINKRGWQADFSWLPLLGSIILSRFSVQGTISVALVSQGEIKRLNKVYRHQDKITDVLSFNLNSKQLLGEIVICLDKAKEQAQAKKQTLKSELQLLTVHGILHLLGYDHTKNARQALRQSKIEQEILSLLNK